MKGAQVLGQVPQRRATPPVKITKPFYLATYPVTQGEYEKVMGDEPQRIHREADGCVRLQAAA